MPDRVGLFTRHRPSGVDTTPHQEHIEFLKLTASAARTTQA